MVERCPEPGEVGCGGAETERLGDTARMVESVAVAVAEGIPPASFMILLRIFNKKEKELLVQLGDTPEEAKSTNEDEKDKT